MSKFSKEQIDMLYEQVKKVDDVGLITHMLQELKEYRGLEEQGLLLKLPCPIGTRVYKIREVYECDFNYNSELCPKVFELEYEDEFFCEHYRFSRYGLSKVEFNFDMLDEVNITIFLTKEEAEKALERLRSVKNE